MDGTIVETEHLWKQATKLVINRRGVILTPEEELYLQTHLNGLGLPQSCALIKEITKTDESIECIIAEKSATARSLYAQGIRLIEGFEDFHTKTRSAALKSAVATNADDHTTELTRKTLNLDRFFGHHLYNITHVNWIGKPEPAIYLYAAQQLKSTPEQCLVIEDSAHGIKAAKAAGMYCIGINTGKKRERLAQADLIIDSYEEIDLKKLL